MSLPTGLESVDTSTHSYCLAPCAPLQPVYPQIHARVLVHAYSRTHKIIVGVVVVVVVVVLGVIVVVLVVVCVYGYVCAWQAA